ncbi:MAG TPA: adenosine deaminase [Mycobacteriales bacterium]|nr:adenosine deaminase [Mycobacteriales bacterium]
MRDLASLPKAHLHLHLTGGMRPATLLELAAGQGRTLPAGLLDPHGARVDVTGRRGWTRFQRLYDAAREVLTGPDQVRRVVREIVEDEAAAGSGWLELQVDPTSYAPRLGGLQAAVELLLDALAAGSTATGVGTALVIAANRTRHPGDAETLARLARRFAGRGVVGFGLSNDETRGLMEDFGKAFRMARDAGLAAVPHAGELRGPRSVRAAVENLGAVRLGHGVRAVEDPALLELLAQRQVVCEVCPASNVALAVLPTLAAVPVAALRAAGVPVALGADDPLLFRSGLLAQYDVARTAMGLSDAALADLAACSVRGSAAPADVQAMLLRGIDRWLDGPPAGQEDICRA